MHPTKEMIKSEIDRMPDEMVEKIYEFIQTIRKSEKQHEKIHTYSLNGRFDHKDIREEAYCNL